MAHGETLSTPGQTDPLINREGQRPGQEEEQTHDHANKHGRPEKKPAVTSPNSAPRHPTPPFLPLTHKAPLLLTVAAACLTLLILLEIISRKSLRDGGIMFAPASSPNSLSTDQEFTYLYLPTIIAVIGSMIWSWIDLDVKRLEAFFQLSKPGGASGKDSILLSYPVDFLALVPLKATRLRHWSVVAAGTAMVMIFWVITPIQAAIFGTDLALRSEPLQGTRSTGLTLAGIKAIDSSILGDPLANDTGDARDVTMIYGQQIHTWLDEVYAIAWLNQSASPFTDKTFALAPFHLPPGNSNDDSNTAPDQILKATTTLYDTDVQCEPANIVPAPDPEYTARGEPRYNITNSHGFVESRGGVPLGNGHADPTPAGTYIGYCNVTGYVSFGRDYNDLDTIESDEMDVYCGSPDASLTYLATWQNQQETALNHTAGLVGTFCTPSYFTQEAEVTVFRRNNSIQDVARKGDRIKLDSATFNISHFENMVAPSTDSNSINLTSIDTTALVSSPQLGYTPKGIVPLTIGIGIGLTSITHAEMPQPGKLADIVTAAHKLMFAIAAQRQMARNPETVSLQVTRQTEVQAVVVTRAFALVIEVLLAIIAAVAVGIWALTRSRRNCLVSDPHSLAAVMALCSTAKSEDLLRTTAAVHDFGESDGLEKKLGRIKYVFARNEGGPDDVDAAFATLGAKSQMLPDRIAPTKPARPLDQGRGEKRGSSSSSSSSPPNPATLTVLSFPAAAFSTLIFILLIIALAVLKHFNDKYNGFNPPANNKATQQLLFNYLPIALGTFIEPAWVYLNRLLAILMPWEELRRGRAKFDTSIGADYVSLPPQVLVLRALRNRHFLLAVVCAMALLSNVLAVAFSGLFKQVSVIEDVDVDVLGSYVPVMQSQGFFGATDFQNLSRNSNTHWSYTDPFLAVDANVTRNLTLPPWTTEGYFFLPFETAAAADGAFPGDLGIRTAFTFGFGVDVPCYTTSEFPNPYATAANFTPMTANLSSLTNTAQHGLLSTSHVLPTNGTKFNCYTRYALFDDSGGSGLRFAVEDEPAYLPYDFPYNQGVPHVDYAIETVIGMDIGLYTDSQGVDQAAICGAGIGLMWMRGHGTPNTTRTAGSDAEGKSLDAVDMSLDTGSGRDPLLLMCYPRLVVGNFSVRIDATERVLSFSPAAGSMPITGDEAARFWNGTGPAPRAVAETNAMFHGEIDMVPEWHNKTVPSDWMNYFLALDGGGGEGGASTLTDPSKTLPFEEKDVAELKGRVEKWYRRIFAAALGLNAQTTFNRTAARIETANTDADTATLPLLSASSLKSTGTIQVRHTKWRMVPAMFVIAMVILVLNLITTMAVFWKRPRPFLPCVPTSLGRQIGLLGVSEIVTGKMRDIVTKREAVNNHDDNDENGNNESEEFDVGEAGGEHVEAADGRIGAEGDGVEKKSLTAGRAGLGEEWVSRSFLRWRGGSKVSSMKQQKEETVTRPIDVERKMRDMGWDFAYGRYVGTDHRPYVGVERSAFVVGGL